jgi:hypothetical protein
LLVEEEHAKPPSQDGDSAVEPMLAVALLRQRWLWRDVSTDGIAEMTLTGA